MEDLRVAQILINNKGKRDLEEEGAIRVHIHSEIIKDTILKQEKSTQRCFLKFIQKNTKLKN